MDPARWRRIGELFDRARPLPATARAALLERECGDDRDLRAEIESLLEADERSATFLEPETAAADAPAPALTPGEEVGIYVVEQEIARGGMGVVYRARDRRLDRPVALKALSPAVPRGPHARERLRREARAAAMLSHPAIAVVHALEERGEDLFIVSELVEGETLRSRLRQGPAPVDEAVRIARRLAEGLAAAHARGIVHRDLKPENVMITPDREVKILDFGIARVDTSQAGPALTAAGLLLGTPGYMAPEQLRGERVDARADVFALGALLYEMVTGAAPFGRGSSPSVVAAALERQPPPVRDIVPQVPEALAAVIETCLQKAPDRRYQSGVEVAAALAALPGLPGTAIPAATGEHASQRAPAGGRAIWWWRFHETTAAVVHGLMLIPAWELVGRVPWGLGRPTFVAIAGAAAATSVLRLHLVFLSRQAPGRLDAGLARLGPWLRWGDRVFAALLAGGGLALAPEAAGRAALLVALAVGSLVASHVIEPSTAEMALRALATPDARTNTGDAASGASR